MCSGRGPAVDAVLGNLKSLLKSGPATDFIIKCGSREWKVHRVVLMLHSDVLSKACNGSFKETEQRILDRSEEEEQCVEALISWLYEFEYTGTTTRTQHPLTLHAKMTILDDKYNMPFLEAEALRRFKDQTMQTGDLEDIKKATSLAYEFDGPTAALRPTLINATSTCRNHIKDLIALDHDFAIDVATHLVDSVPSAVKNKNKIAVANDIPQSLCTLVTQILLYLRS